LAGFEVTLYGRFWVTPEDIPVTNGVACKPCRNPEGDANV